MQTPQIKKGQWIFRIRKYDPLTSRTIEMPYISLGKLQHVTKAQARERARLVQRVKKDIINGDEFSFPWENEDGELEIKSYTLIQGSNEWLEHKSKSVKKSTVEIYTLALDHFIQYMGGKTPINQISTRSTDAFRDYLVDKGYSKSSINRWIRPIKSMFTYFYDHDLIVKVPKIKQLKEPKRRPTYITDDEFQSIVDLVGIDSFYAKVFWFYRETGCTLNEPFMGSLHGPWLVIPNSSKGGVEREIPLQKELITIYDELTSWYCNSLLKKQDRGRDLSKKFKKCLRKIGADEMKSFHSLRHTFAVRKLLENVPIYKIQRLLGHASVQTTEIYTKLELSRVRIDFPTIVQNQLISMENSGFWGTNSWGTFEPNENFTDERVNR